MLKILITGSAGFIGSTVVCHIVRDTQDSVINLDKLTYAGNLESLVDVSSSERYAFEQVDIYNRVELGRVFSLYQPDEVAAGEALPLFTETTPYTPPVAPIRPPKLPAIIWCVPGATLTACQPSSPTAPITRAISFPREADLAGDSQRAGWQAAAGLWQGRPDP